MQSKITLGQYIPGNSIVHRLDPRTKILLMIGYIVLVFLVKIIPLFVIPVLYLLIVFILAKIPASYVGSSIRPIRFLLVFMFIINLFFTQGETILFQFWIIKITKEALVQSFFITFRLLLLVIGTSILTLTTTPIALTDGMEKLFAPLSVFHFPAHELAMMMTIALRFIPTLIEEVDRIQKAQVARGADFMSGNIFARAKGMLPILVPLFVSSFRRADDLAMAMESRCYHGGAGRTKLYNLKMGMIDLFAILFFLIFLGMVIVANRYFA